MARRRMLKARFYGLIGAGAFAIAASLLIVVLVLANRDRAGAGATDPDAPAPPDIRDALPTQANQGALAGRDLLVQMMDKEDPTRQAGELRAAVIDPMPLPGHYDVDKPQIWMFLKSGKTLYVRADSGQLVMPSRRQEPESGVLRGAVEIRIYDKIGVGGEKELGPPSLTARTPLLTFDTTVPELESPQPFTVEGRGIRFEGRSLRVLASQTRERLELVEVLGGGSLTYTPPKDGEKRQAAAAPSGEAHVLGSAAKASARVVRASFVQPLETATRADGQTPDPDAPVIVNYLTTFADDVVVSQTSRTLQGDRLDVWSRLIDGRLPDDAIGGNRPPDGARAEASPAPTAAPEQGPEQASANTTPSEKPAPAAVSPLDDSVRLSWTGPMVARPLGTEPRELETNHVYLRVTADKRGTVAMGDSQTGAAGRCAVLDYGATSQDLVLATPGAGGATLSMPGQGRMTATRIEQNLGSGIGHVPGPGLIEALKAEEPADNDRPMARWSESATFIFQVEEDRMSDRIREAILLGDVAASSQGSSLHGEAVHAYFDAATGSDSGSPSLTRMRAEGSVRTRDAKGNALDADTLDVAFVPGRADADPSVATALGSVRVESAGGDIVTAALIEAELWRDEADQLGARTVRAEEWVEVTTASGQRALTPKLLADVPGEVIDLIGPGSRAIQTRDGITTSVAGDSIRLFGKSRAIQVRGAGTFEHGPGADAIAAVAAGPPARTISARWNESMAFDDAAGTLDACGDVHAESTLGVIERQELDADAITARIMPAATHEQLSRDAKRDGLPAPERSLLFAQARVDPSVSGGGTESRVQSVYYAAPSDDVLSGPTVETRPRIERLFQAQGATITADNEAGSVEIPGPGRMVVADMRPRTGSSDEPGQTPSAGSSRGRSLFEWTGGMRFEHASGIVRLSDHATMVQRRLEDGGVLNVAANELEARVRDIGSEGSPSGAGPAGPGEGMELTGVTARGAVVVTERTGTPLTLKREVLAELLDYDITRGVAEAKAPDGGLVTLLETNRGTPVNARSISWDLIKDRVEIRGMSTITAPR